MIRRPDNWAQLAPLVTPLRKACLVFLDAIFSIEIFLKQSHSEIRMLLSTDTSVSAPILSKSEKTLMSLNSKQT